MVSGCNTHPIPDNITSDSTYSIVMKIRCETRDAVSKAAIEYMLSDERPLKTREVGSRYQRNPGALRTFNPQEVDAKTAEYFQRYAKSYILYDFTFDITEKANGGFVFNPLRTFTNGTQGLALSASLGRENQSIRAFRMGDSVSDLMALYQGDKCDNPPGKSVLYPITGKVGVEEVIQTYAKLHRNGVFKPQENAGQFTSTIEFTTAVKGGLTPKITLDSLGGRTSLEESTLRADAERTDKHKVIFSIDTPDAEEAKQTARGVSPKASIDRASKNLDFQIQRQELRTLRLLDLGQ